MGIQNRTLFLILFSFLISFSSIAQDSTNRVAPFTGSAGFRKFSFGINAGALAPVVWTGGTNDFTKYFVELGYGANIRYQFNHYLALQLDGIRGKLRADNSKALGNGLPPGRAVYSHTTDLDGVGTLSAQVTFGNINWLRRKPFIVPYLQGEVCTQGYNHRS
jgi:OmpA-OmpF porin, OOP family